MDIAILPNDTAAVLLATLRRLEQWHARESVKHQEESAFYGDLVQKLAWPTRAPKAPEVEEVVVGDFESEATNDH